MCFARCFRDGEPLDQDESPPGLVSLFTEDLSDAALNEVRPVVELYFKRLRLANQTY